MKTARSIIAVTLVAIVSAPAGALEIDPLVPPEINLGGRVIATAAYVRDTDDAGGSDSQSVNDIADSSLLFGFAKYLFDSTAYGFGNFGVKLPEDGTDLGDDIYVHEASVGIGDKRYELKLGRSRLGNTLLAFPTLRDDDLLDFTHVPNGSSSAEAEEYQIFGNVVEGRWWFTPSVGLDAGFTARARTDAAGERISGEEFNGARLGLAYEVPESIKFTRGLRYAGIRLDAQRVNDQGPGLRSDRMNSWIAAAAFNLSDNPEATWNLDVQAIANAGTGLQSIAEHVDRARAKSRALVAALRYGERPALQTRWQAALTLGVKDYSDFDQAKTYVVAPSYGYRLGSGVELLAQYQYAKNDTALAAATGVETERRVELGLMFSFAHTFNESVGERQSILNIEHNMFDLGPAGGGH
jgi:hypothetical protein